MTYEFLIFRDHNIKMWPETIPANFKDEIENGSYEVNDGKGNLICKGIFSDGFRLGKWIYHPTVDKELNIDWKKYTGRSDSSIQMNYPNTWKILEDESRPFQASFPLKSNESDKGKYFIILSHNKDSIGMDLKGYQEFYKAQTLSTEKVKEYAHFVFETISGKMFYFMRYIITRGDEEFLMFAFIGDVGSNVYDITYSSNNEDYEGKHIVFFDMIRSLVINDKRFFSPFDPIKQFERLEYQSDEPKSI